MNQECPMKRVLPAATRPRLAGLALRGFLVLLLPLLPLALATGCSGKSNPTATEPPVITAQPVDVSTVSGRPVTFSITATGQATLAYQWAKDGVTILGATASSYVLFSPRVQDAGKYTVKVTNTLGTATSSAATLTVAQAVLITTPLGIAVDASGNLYVSDRDDHVIWKVTPTHQKILLAGTQGLAGSADGLGGAARFTNPGGLALDPAGNLLVADTGNHTVRRVALDGTVTTLAGSPGVSGATDAVGLLARFNAPYGLAVTGTGIVYIADSLNHTIRRMGSDGTVTTLAGSAGSSGRVDGQGSLARFNQPNGLALGPDGTLAVADYGNSNIRSVSSAGLVTTLAGQLNVVGFADGAAASALFRLPVGIAVDASGTVWIADTQNHAIRRITTAGVVSTQAGLGSTAGNVDGSNTAARLNQPSGLAFTPSGSLVILDTGNHLLRSLSTAGAVTTYTLP
jgi:sugar lactone lactonase YvrE